MENAKNVLFSVELVVLTTTSALRVGQEVIFLVLTVRIALHHVLNVSLLVPVPLANPSIFWNKGSANLVALAVSHAKAAVFAQNARKLTCSSMEVFARHAMPTVPHVLERLLLNA